MIWDIGHTKALGVGLLLVAACLGAAAYTHSLIVRAENDATQKTEAKYQKMLADQSAAFDTKLQAREVQHQADLQALNSRFQSAATPEQIAHLATQLIGLKNPIQIVTPAATTDNPNPKPVAQVALEDAPAAKQYLQECETCKLELPKLQADLADREAQMKLAQQQIESIQSQRDAAIKASKGGSFWRRLKNNAKWLVIGAAGGAIAVEAVKR